MQNSIHSNTWKSLTRPEKIEFICEDSEAEILCDIIKINSAIGHDDDGIIIGQPAEKIIPLSSKKNVGKVE